MITIDYTNNNLTPLQTYFPEITIQEQIVLSWTKNLLKLKTYFNENEVIKISTESSDITFNEHLACYKKTISQIQFYSYFSAITYAETPFNNDKKKQDLELIALDYRKLIYNSVTMNEKTIITDYTLFYAGEKQREEVQQWPSIPFTLNDFHARINHIAGELKEFLDDISSHRCSHQAHLNSNYINVTQIELYIMYAYRLLHSMVNIFSTEEFDHFYAMILEKHDCLIAINLNYIIHGYFNPEWYNSIN